MLPRRRLSGIMPNKMEPLRSPLPEHFPEASSPALPMLRRDEGAISAHEALCRMRARGITIKAWAANNGYHFSVVYSVLSGRRKCLRGQSHAIAVALGLKVSTQ